MFELQNSTPNVYYRKRGCDGLASFIPYDIVCKCLIIEKLKPKDPHFSLNSALLMICFQSPNLAE